MRWKAAITLLVVLCLTAAGYIVWATSHQSLVLTLTNSYACEIGVIRVSTSNQSQAVQRTWMGVLIPDGTGKFDFDLGDSFEFGPLDYKALPSSAWTLDVEYVRTIHPKRTETIGVGYVAEPSVDLPAEEYTI